MEFTNKGIKLLSHSWLDKDTIICNPEMFEKLKSLMLAQENKECLST